MSPHVDDKHECNNEPSQESVQDEVMDLLAEVESQFDRIRSIRREQDETVRTLSTRAEDLVEAEARLRAQESTLQEEWNEREQEFLKQCDGQLDALHAATDVIARRGRRIQQLTHWMTRAQRDRRRMRRRIMGIRQAVRRLLQERTDYELRMTELQEKHTTDQNTIQVQSDQLTITTQKMREFSTMLQEQTIRLEEGAAAMIETRELRSKLKRVEAELEQAKTNTVTTPVVVDETKAESPSSGHLKRRRRRLQHFRRLLREQARRLPQVAQLEAARRRQETELLEQQRHLDEVRRVLGESETRMIQRWAAGRAIQVTGWVVLLSLLIGVGSWWTANHFDPPTVRSHVVIGPVLSGQDELKPGILNDWKSWHVQLIKSEGFAEKVAQRLAGHTGAPVDPALVQFQIDNALDSDLNDPNALRFSLIGEAGTKTRNWLDAFARTLVSESSRTARNRPDPILAQIRNRYVESGQERYANSDRTPIEDTRWRTALLIFLSSVLACLVLGSIIYGHLSKARRMIQDLEPDMEYEPQNGHAANVLSDAAGS